ncbi:MAG: chromate efflux transporter [Candidatus Kurthia intestinigallinarum]
MGQLLVIFWTALKLGLVSFGGPSAHLAYFERVYVKEKKWLTAVEYTDLVSLSQFLPGPASSQVGMGIGLKKGGILGSIVAFLGFTLPSVVVLMVFAYIHAKGNWSLDWLHGLKLVAVAIVAHAILDMSKKIWHSKMAIILTVVATAVLLSWQTTYSTIIVLLIAALAGQLFLRQQQPALLVENVISKRIAAGFLIAFGVLLVALPLIAKLWPTTWLVMFEKFYTAGALVFGGGHVVLPLLEERFVETGLISLNDFLVGYGAVQAVPGPLFTFASYLGMVIGGIPMALLATVAIFLPAFLLIIGAYPFWQQIRSNPKWCGAFNGMNAAVIGVLIAAWITPIVTSTIHSWLDILWVILLFAMLLKWSPLLVVVVGILIGVFF